MDHARPVFSLGPWDATPSCLSSSSTGCSWLVSGAICSSCLRSPRGGASQASALGPLLSSVYTPSLSDLVGPHGFKYQPRADNSQVYVCSQNSQLSIRLPTQRLRVLMWIPVLHPSRVPDGPLLLSRPSQRTRRSVLPRLECLCSDHTCVSLPIPAGSVFKTGPESDHCSTPSVLAALAPPSHHRLFVSILPGLPVPVLVHLRSLCNTATRVTF